MCNIDRTKTNYQQEQKKRKVYCTRKVGVIYYELINIFDPYFTIVNIILCRTNIVRYSVHRCDV